MSNITARQAILDALDTHASDNNLQAAATILMDAIDMFGIAEPVTFLMAVCVWLLRQVAMDQDIAVSDVIAKLREAATRWDEEDE